MKFLVRLKLTILLPFLIFLPVSAQQATSIPSSLRGGNVRCDQVTISLALELTQQGWLYVMPQPKSLQAAWGNPDGRTTWFLGYWINKTTQKTSAEIPIKSEDGIYLGDNKGIRSWRRGGTPPPPSQLQWLCSISGGIAPK
jgi:hypothetical protein